MYFIVHFTFLITCNNSYIFPNILHTIYIELKSKFCPYCSLIFLVLLLHVFIKINTLATTPPRVPLVCLNIIVYSFAL